MRSAFRLGVSGIFVAVLGPAVLSAAAPAAADCVSSNGTTICSQGDVRGPNTGGGPGTGGGYTPYICGYDGWCDYDYGWNIDVDLGRPGGGYPGGPGIGGGRGR